MAYASLVSLQNTADLILNNNEYSISVDERDSIKSIREYADILTSFLENYPEKATQKEGKIRDLANEAEDLIEYFMWDRFQMYQVAGLSRCELKRRLKRLSESLGTITGDLMDYRAAHLPAAAISSSRVALAATAKNDAVIGLDEDLFALKDRLCGSSKLEVIPIVGMGGIGKTTLARYACDDPLIMEYFHIRAFVQVSQHYSAKVVLTNLLASLNLFLDEMIGEINESEVCESSKGQNLSSEQMIGEMNESEVCESSKGQNLSSEQMIGEMNESEVYESSKGQNLSSEQMIGEMNESEVCESSKGQNLSSEQMIGEMNESEVYESAKGLNLSKEQIIGEMNESDIKTNVYKSLKGRRYLIVMDDIWSTEAWDNVRRILPDDNNGSRIMLTTRLSDVAAYASCGSPVLEMKLMDENQSWDLIKQKVFTDSQDCPPELEDIGKEVARCCRGLPLAVVLVAGVLSTTIKTRASWEKIARNVNSVVDGQLDEILSLSYTLLPHHLRPCFLFMGGFPEDYKIRVWKLINLWVAEGFLKCESGSKSLEEVAEECLEDLVKRNLVLVTSRKSNGKIKSCSLHDLVRDMCVRRAQEEKFLLMDRCAFPDERRVSLVHSDINEIWTPTIRTILYFRTRDSSSASLVKFRLLRVLDMYDDMDQVFELFHLRYLALAFFGEIPANILKLQNLQTLIIRSSEEFKTSRLPQEIWRMPHLRHLVITPYYHKLLYPTDGSTPPLENLQTLSGVASFACTERNLKMIPNLKKFVFSTTEQYCNLYNLVNLHQLEKLTIVNLSRWQRRNPSLPRLTFPRSLKKLTLVGGRPSWKDISIAGSLPNLQVLKLKNDARDGDACDGDTWVTVNGGFPELKFLLIEHSNLRHWITETDHFPRLKRLALRRCKNLQEIPKNIGEIPTLEVIEVDTWKKSLVNSAKQIQEDQQAYGNDAFQVHVTKAVETKADEKKHTLIMTYVEEIIMTTLAAHMASEWAEGSTKKRKERGR